MQDIITVLGIEKVAIIAGLMFLGLAVTVFACLPSAYVHRITALFKRLH